jgi:hypothetical protein
MEVNNSGLYCILREPNRQQVLWSAIEDGSVIGIE